MPRKKAPEIKKTVDPNVVGLKAEVISQPITETLEQNYMPYAMSVIVSRAIPEIDGFKPSHRKLLYTMYKMNLLSGGRTKSANIVGQTMRLNPHGDAAIYETMVRLSKGYGALLTPFVDSKGNFGKVFSRDMSYAASRYTEAKLAPICAELFGDIDSDTVDFVDNYDGSMKEPALLPTRFPNVLVSANLGIAVGMASQICGCIISAPTPRMSPIDCAWFSYVRCAATFWPKSPPSLTANAMPHSFLQISETSGLLTPSTPLMQLYAVIRPGARPSRTAGSNAFK